MPPGPLNTVIFYLPQSLRRAKITGMGDLSVYERRERVHVLVFRFFGLIRPLTKTASTPRSASMLSAGGATLAVLGIPFAALVAWPAVIVAVIGLYAAIGYALLAYVRRLSMRVAPGHDRGINQRDFLNAPRSPDAGYRLVRPKDATWAQLYPYVDLSDHSRFIQMENDLTREQRYELYERWYGLCPDGFMHLEKQIGERWRPISVSIMLPLSGFGYRAITAKSEPRRLSVIELDRDGIKPRVTRTNPFLLIDTWIVDREGGYGGTGHGKSENRGGNANLLVLRHLAQFWHPAHGLKHVSILVETANRHLVPALEMLSFRQSGSSNIDEEFYLTTPMQFGAMYPEEFGRLKEALEAAEALDVVIGTAPVPAGWYYRHE